jgi:hypothetical protein
MSAVSMKIGLGFVAVIVLFGVAQAQVLNALLVFAAAGIIPGTDIVLSPETTFYMLAGWALLGAALLFRSHILRLRARPALEALIVQHLATSQKSEAVPRRPRLRARIVNALGVVRSRAVATAKELHAEIKSFKLPFVIAVQMVRIKNPLVRFEQLRPLLLMRLGEIIETTARAVRTANQWSHAVGMWLIEARLYIDRWFSK